MTNTKCRSQTFMISEASGRASRGVASVTLSAPMARILIADDHDAIRDGMAIALSRLGHDVLAVRGGAEAIAAYRKKPAEVVVTDLRMIPVDGIQVVKRLRELDPDATVLVVSAHGTIAIAVEAMRGGAIDFIEKPFSPDVLRARVEKAIEIARERKGARTARGRAEALEEDLGRDRPHGLVGSSEPMRRVLDQVRKVASTDATVLVLGESGTGKELVARAHPRREPAPRASPSSSINCAALPEGLLESRAVRPREGRVHRRDPPQARPLRARRRRHALPRRDRRDPAAVQVKLLRVLQEREFERVGGEETVEVDVRVVAATNRDLGADGRGGPLPRGPLLPAERGADPAAAAPRAPRRRRASSRGSSSRKHRPADRASAVTGLAPEALGAPRAPPLAGQRARARERDRAGARVRGG